VIAASLPSVSKESGRTRRLDWSRRVTIGGRLAHDRMNSCTGGERTGLPSDGIGEASGEIESSGSRCSSPGPFGGGCDGGVAMLKDDPLISLRSRWSLVRYWRRAVRSRDSVLADQWRALPGRVPPSRGGAGEVIAPDDGIRSKGAQCEREHGRSRPTSVGAAWTQ